MPEALSPQLRAGSEFRRSTLVSSADVLHSPLTTDITSPSPSPPIHHSKDDGESRLRCSMLCRQSTAFLCSAGILDIHLALRSALTAPKPLTLKLSKHVSLQRPTSRKRQVRRPRRNLDTDLASHARSRCSLLFRLRQAVRRAHRTLAFTSQIRELLLPACDVQCMHLFVPGVTEIIP
jgi:hypothetical protein